jgi:hypothetical protein
MRRAAADRPLIVEEESGIAWCEKRFLDFHGNGKAENGFILGDLRVGLC